MSIQSIGAILAIIAVGWLVYPTLKPEFWDRHCDGCACDEHEDDDSFDTVALPDGEQSVGDSLDAHWEAARAMLGTDVSLAQSRESRALAAQYLSAYVAKDYGRMQAIRSASDPDELIAGLLTTSETFALVISVLRDVDLAEVLQRDCEATIGHLASPDH